MLPEANALDVARVAVVVVNAAMLCIFALLALLICITLRVKFIKTKREKEDKMEDF